MGRWRGSTSERSAADGGARTATGVYAKPVAAALVAAAGVLASAGGDGLSGGDWLRAVLIALVAFAVVAAVPIRAAEPATVEDP